MNNIFQVNKNGKIIPIFKNNISKEDFTSFIISINSSKMKEIILSLKKIIKDNYEIRQILLDINDIYYIEKGFIEVLIEQYILKQNDDKINQLLYNYFVFISNLFFQIRKSIYDFIYKIISKIFQDFKQNVNLNFEIFNKSIDLLNIFYIKKEYPEILNFQDNFFYLFDNEIKTNINDN